RPLRGEPRQVAPRACRDPPPEASAAGRGEGPAGGGQDTHPDHPLYLPGDLRRDPGAGPDPCDAVASQRDAMTTLWRGRPTRTGTAPSRSATRMNRTSKRNPDFIKVRSCWNRWTAIIELFARRRPGRHRVDL